ncbi:hypothetical protein RF11_04759 [Thelohanellus kitauei]|uniref:Uncharacterized protein n=1 Tax=Thelohanellus kitauei TaxID=669202 RepID=A0A0C2MHL9_THEKT|nr:hypothetical protein RF11_04759 [Thelohanellus kitauei]
MKKEHQSTNNESVQNFKFDSFDVESGNMVNYISRFKPEEENRMFLLHNICENPYDILAYGFDGAEELHETPLEKFIQAKPTQIEIRGEGNIPGICSVNEEGCQRMSLEHLWTSEYRTKLWLVYNRDRQPVALSKIIICWG